MCFLGLEPCFICLHILISICRNKWKQVHEWLDGWMDNGWVMDGC